jgi:hypothetical protein
VIELSCTLARRFLAVLRASAPVGQGKGPCPLVLCRSGRSGLTLSCRLGADGLRHHTPGAFPADTLALPATLLNQLKGPGRVVALEQTAPGKGRATRQGGDGPQAIDFDAADPASLPAPPEPCPAAARLEPSFLGALGEAARAAAREPVRHALGHVLLRGRDGAVVGTDGRQLLVQRGFVLPWADDRFLPALPAFACRELPADQPVSLGCSGKRVTVEVGPWLFSVECDSSMRYPDVDAVLPDPSRQRTRVRFDPEDIRTLIRELPRLPAQADKQRPVTLAAGKAVAVRAREGDGPVEEVPLPRSKGEGPALEVVTDRRYLLRALQLGFDEVLIDKPGTPLLCTDARRSYLWMPLSDEAVAGQAKPQPVKEFGPAPSPPAAAPPQPRRNPTMPANDPRPDVIRNGAPPVGEPPDPLLEAGALRGLLQEALARTSRLLAALKDQRRQSRVILSVADSLRKLHQP